MRWEMKTCIASTTFNRSKSRCVLTNHVTDASYQLEVTTEAKLISDIEVDIIRKWGKIKEVTTSAISYTMQFCRSWIQETLDSGVPKGSRAETKTGGSPPKFTDIRLVRGKKSDILVEGGSMSEKHGTYFSISIISSQLGGGVDARVSF